MQLVNNFISSIIARVWNQTHDEEGQTLVEYGLIVALLSIAAILVLGALGTSINDVFETVSGKLDSAAATP
ncbi:MAG TPA: Flp family type IVb pilin [Dehalococcoidia bacterium]|nr:Flp family type IVb pilin [Dehalococcoidia bacterium]